MKQRIFLAAFPPSWDGVAPSVSRQPAVIGSFVDGRRGASLLNSNKLGQDAFPAEGCLTELLEIKARSPFTNLFPRSVVYCYIRVLSLVSSVVLRIALVVSEKGIRILAHGDIIQKF